MTRPATAIAVLVLVLLHALLQVGRTVASVIGVAVFVMAHPGFSSTPVLLLSAAWGNLLGLVLAAGDVVLGLWFFRCAPLARVLLTVWVAFAGLVTLGGAVSSLTVVADPSIPVLVVSFVQLGLSAAAVVLLWRPRTTAWLRGASVGPARPGL